MYRSLERWLRELVAAAAGDERRPQLAASHRPSRRPDLLQVPARARLPPPPPLLMAEHPSSSATATATAAVLPTSSSAGARTIARSRRLPTDGSGRDEFSGRDWCFLQKITAPDATHVRT